MFKFGLNEIYSNYSYSNEAKDSERAHAILDEIFDDLAKFLSYEMHEQFYNLVISYSSEVEERSFKNGFNCAVQLMKECGL